MIIVNFKNVKKGKEVLGFAKEMDGLDIVVAVPSSEIKEVSNNTGLKVFSQSVSGFNDEKGFLSVSDTKRAGAEGTLLNHNDHPIAIDKIIGAVKECHVEGLKVVVCVKDFDDMGKLLRLRPFAIAYEEPRLIGSKDSVTNYPEKIKGFVGFFGESEVLALCGAGVNSREDVKKAFNLGCKGVLVSSAVMKAGDPGEVLEGMVKEDENL
jgi:triosephosphate isomerase